MKRLKYLLIIGVILYSVWALIPSIQFYSMDSVAREELTPDERDKYLDEAIKLGLDLQGGMHLVLEIDDTELPEEAKSDALDRAIRIIRNRIDQFGVAEPTIQKQGDKRIIVQLPGLQDSQRAKDIIGQTAFLEFKMVREPTEIAAIARELDTALRGVKIEGTRVDTTGIVAPDTTTSTAPADTASQGHRRQRSGCRQ